MYCTVYTGTQLYIILHYFLPTRNDGLWCLMVTLRRHHKRHDWPFQMANVNRLTVNQ